MTNETIYPLRGELEIPGDKSISHRAVMFGSISNGLTEITNFLQGADCLATIDCFRNMGIEIDNTSDRILVHVKDFTVSPNLPVLWTYVTVEQQPD